MITDVTRRSLIEKLYDECKDSRDFQSSRKWQTIVIYIALLTLFIGNFDSLKLNKQVAELFEELSLNYIDKDILSDDILRCCTEAERQRILKELGIE